MTEENIWKVYNFVNDWKAGRYGIVDFESCAISNLHLDNEIDEKKLDELAFNYVNHIEWLNGNTIEVQEKCRKYGFIAGYRKALEL